MAAAGILSAMKDKSPKCQRHKGCGLCDTEKRAGNGAARRPSRDRRSIEGAKVAVEELRVGPILMVG